MKFGAFMKSILVAYCFCVLACFAEGSKPTGEYAHEGAIAEDTGKERTVTSKKRDSRKQNGSINGSEKCTFIWKEKNGFCQNSVSEHKNTLKDFNSKVVSEILASSGFGDDSLSDLHQCANMVLVSTIARCLNGDFSAQNVSGPGKKCFLENAPKIWESASSLYTKSGK